MSLAKPIEAQNPKDEANKRRRPRGEFQNSRRAAKPASSSAPPNRSSGTLLGGLMLGVACPFAAVSIFSPDLTGSLGQSFASMTDGLVGQAKLLLPLVIAGYGLHFLFPRSRRPVQMTWAPTLLWSNLVLLAQRMGGQGGQIGTIFDEILLRSVGPVGAWMVAVLGLPICLSWVFRVRLADCGHWIAEQLHRFQDWANHALDGLRASYQAQGPSPLAWVSSEDELGIVGSFESDESMERPLPFHSVEDRPTGKVLGRSLPDPKPVGKKGPIQNRDLRQQAEPAWDSHEEDDLPFEGTRLQPRGRGDKSVRGGTHSQGASGEFPSLACSQEAPDTVVAAPSLLKKMGPRAGGAATGNDSVPIEEDLPGRHLGPKAPEILDFRGQEISHSLEGALAPISVLAPRPTATGDREFVGSDCALMGSASNDQAITTEAAAEACSEMSGGRRAAGLNPVRDFGIVEGEPIIDSEVDAEATEQSCLETGFGRQDARSTSFEHASVLQGDSDLTDLAGDAARVAAKQIDGGAPLELSQNNCAPFEGPDCDEESLEPVDEELVLEVPPPQKNDPAIGEGPPRRFTEIAADGQMLLFPEPEKEPAPTYRLPPLALLNDTPGAFANKVVEDKSAELLDALASFGVAANLLDIVRGPAVTRYELQPARGVKVSRFTSLTNDIALALAATAVRIEAPIPGKSAIGIEVPNANTDLVVIKDIIASQRFRKSVGMSIALGKDLGGNPIFANLQKMPHLLVAGTTGSGKSVCVNALILSLLYRFSPREVQILMIDPKQVELSIYEGIPHLICLSKGADGAPAKKEGAIICDPKKAALALHQIVELMEFRYGLFAQVRVRNLEEYNQTGEDPLPWVVVIIDELADLMMVAAKTVETSICRIAQKARAAGIHLVLATQRPSADVITGLIKVNVPSRIAFAVSSQVDSRVILDTGGAEQLLGKGDMLFCPVDASDPRRVQGCFVTNEEILRIVEWWRAQASPENLIQLKAADVAESEDQEEEEADADDEMVQQALGVILKRRQASASLLQTELKVGYARARRLIYLMEKKGYIGPQDGSKPRKILYGLSE